MAPDLRWTTGGELGASWGEHTGDGAVKVHVDMRRRVVKCKLDFFKRG